MLEISVLNSTGAGSESRTMCSMRKFAGVFELVGLLLMRGTLETRYWMYDLRVFCLKKIQDQITRGDRVAF